MKTEKAMAKKLIEREERLAQDATEYSENDQTLQTVLSMKSNVERGESRGERRAMNGNEKEKALKKRIQSSKPGPAFYYEASKDAVDEFKQLHNARMPRIQQIIERNKQAAIEKMYKEMREGKKEQLPSRRPMKPLSKLNQLIYGQFFISDMQ